MQGERDDEMMNSACPAQNTKSEPEPNEVRLTEARTAHRAMVIPPHVPRDRSWRGNPTSHRMPEESDNTDLRSPARNKLKEARDGPSGPRMTAATPKVLNRFY